MLDTTPISVESYIVKRIYINTYYLAYVTGRSVPASTAQALWENTSGLVWIGTSGWKISVEG
jgi:hypothetical protein